MEEDEKLRRLCERIRNYATYKGAGNDAEDIAQETWITLKEKQDEYRGKSDEEIFRIAHEIARKKLANLRRRRYKSDEIGGDSLNTHSNAFSSKQTPQAILEEDQRDQCIQQVLRLLPNERYRKLLRLRWKQDLDWSDIEKQFKEPRSNLQVAYSRAYTQFQKRVLEECLS